jgi:hypothetical protein
MVSTLQSSQKNHLPAFVAGRYESSSSSPPRGLDDDEEDDEEDDRKPAAKPSNKQDDNNMLIDQNDAAGVSLLDQQQQPVQSNETASTSASSSSDQESSTVDDILRQQSTGDNDAATALSTNEDDEATTIAIDSSLSALRDLVSKESPEMRSRNKAILFRLFANHDNQSLSRLAKDCSVPSLESLLLLDQTRRKHADTKSPAADDDDNSSNNNNNNNDEGLVVQSSSSGSGTSTAMACMPQAIAAFIDDTRLQSQSTPNNLALPVRRSAVTSKPLSDLESETRSWHTSSLSNNHHPCSSSTNNNGNDYRSSNTRVRSYSLHFTECSVTSIARWAAMHSRAQAQTQQQQQLSTSNNSIDDNESSSTSPGIMGKEAATGESSTTRDDNCQYYYTRPFAPTTVDVRFRKCGLCRVWGHFEVECPSQTSHQRLRFARAIIKGKGGITASTLPASSSLLSGEMTTNPSTNNTEINDMIVEAENEDEDETVAVDEVSIETCRGFLIEQRKEPRVKDGSARIQNKKRKRAEFKRDEEVTEVDGLLIKATSTCPITAASNEPGPFFEGDIVAWSDEPGSSTGESRVYVGVIVSHQTDAINAKVRCLRIIPPEGPATDCTSHVPIQRLTLLKNLNADAEAAISSSSSIHSIHI